MQEAIKSHDARIVSASTEMMLSTLNHDASMLRSYLIKESSSQTQASKQAGNSPREPQGLLASLIHALLHYQVPPHLHFCRARISKKRHAASQYVSRPKHLKNGLGS